MHRTKYILMLLLGWAAFCRAETTVIVLHLPTAVTFQSFSNTGGTTEIKLSANALAVGFPSVPVGTIVQAAGDTCVIRIPTADGHVPGFQVVPAGAGPLAIEIGTGAAAAPAPITGSSPNPPAAPVVAGGGRGEPPPSPNPGVGNSPANAGANQGQGAAPPAPAAPAKDAGASDLAGALDKIFPDAGPIGFDPIAKADYALPESTAATAIGAANSLVRPSTPREVVTSLLSNFDKDGKLQAGLSLALTPYPLLRKEPVSADDYDKPGTRFLTNLQLSLAGRADDTIVTDGAKAARYSAGLSMVFFDDGDLRLDRVLLSRIATLLHQDVSTAVFEQKDGLLPPITAEKLNGAKKLWDDAKAKNWNAASAGLGVAPAFLSLSGKLSDAKDDGVMVWTSLSSPGPDSMAIATQFIFGGNGRFNQRVQHNNVWTRTDVLDFGAQIRCGAPDFNFFAQTQYRRRTFSNDDKKAQFVYELGLERRLAQGVWLNLAWTNDDTVTGGTTIRSGVRYGFGTKAVLAPQP